MLLPFTTPVNRRPSFHYITRMQLLPSGARCFILGSGPSAAQSPLVAFASRCLLLRCPGLVPETGFRTESRRAKPHNQPVVACTHFRVTVGCMCTRIVSVRGDVEHESRSAPGGAHSSARVGSGEWPSRSAFQYMRRPDWGFFGAAAQRALCGRGLSMVCMEMADARRPCAVTHFPDVEAAAGRSSRSVALGLAAWSFACVHDESEAWLSPSVHRLRPGCLGAVLRRNSIGCIAASETKTSGPEVAMASGAKQQPGLWEGPVLNYRPSRIRCSIQDQGAGGQLDESRVLGGFELLSRCASSLRFALTSTERDPRAK